MEVVQVVIAALKNLLHNTIYTVDLVQVQYFLNILSDKKCLHEMWHRQMNFYQTETIWPINHAWKEEDKAVLLSERYLQSSVLVCWGNM